MRSKNVYIGVFPPPYGGITVKNVLLCNLIKTKKELEILNLFGAKHKKTECVLAYLKAVMCFGLGKQIIYGLDSKRLKLMMKFHRLFRKSLKQTVVIAMGGMFPEKVEKDAGLKNSLLSVKVIFVETEGMKERFEKMGFCNAELFPNPKPEKGACEPRENWTGPLQLVFFSQISEEKGIIDMIELAELLNNENIPYHLDFYGHIAANIEERFMNFIETTENVSYQGIFDSTKSDVYRKLNEYDILLFPTHYTTEGVPGILVEAKMAGLAVVTSAVSYNKEIVHEEKKEGIIVKNHYPQEMMEAVRKCGQDRKFLHDIKQASFDSRKSFSLEEYEKAIIDKLV